MLNPAINQNEIMKSRTLAGNNQFPRMHVSLYVSDIQKSVDFYTQFFGQAPNKQKPNYAKFVLDKPSLIISFVENKDRVQSNFGHLGFQVETLDELNTKLAEAKTKNLVIISQGLKVICAANYL